MEKPDDERPLNLRDREILFELSLNGRVSLTGLADRVDLSKQVVSYRIKQMEEKKIIKRYYAITNVYRLGKAHYRVFIKYRNMSPEIEKELRDYLIRDPRIAWVLYLDGDFDVFFVVWADNIIRFEAVYDGIIGKFGKYFQEKYFSIATRIEYLPYHFLVERKSRISESFIFGDGFTCCELDDLEKDILTLLNHNGRMYATAMAQELAVSPTVIKRKIQGLTDNRIVIGFNVKIDHNLLGYTYQKVLLKLNNTSRPELDRLSSYLKKKRSVIYLLKTIGTYDFEFELMTRSNEEFYNLIKELRMDFAHNIKDHSIVVMNEEPKYEHLAL
jgi:DNA-binding Lrp family transcriptional regulator